MSRRLRVYLAFLLLLLVLLIISGPPLMLLHESGIKSYTLIHFYLAQLGLFVIVGALLGICGHFAYEIKKSGSWKVDIPKITILGIPLGLVACSYLIYFGIDIPWMIKKVFAYIVNIEVGQVVAAQIILGYVVISSFYKKGC
ncbi:MAG: hypothetical protein WC147_06125 [Syntrophomonas sp.]|nr:hypothetical protein [Bacilli bacterium]